MDWDRPAELITRLPAPSDTLRKVVSTKSFGQREFPESIPITHAVALAAAAQARAQGVTRFQRVFDDVRVLGPRQNDYLVVLANGRPPRFVLSEGLQPIPAVVVDLAELRCSILDGSVIEH